MEITLQIVWLLVIDAIFIALCVLGLLALAKYKPATFAVLHRNFVGYFSNPTGYVFLCLFVLLSSFAAFWPHEFFNSNLANLAQLNKYFPFIMLVFIPAITMSIWAEERREGTDELLLTIPADDFDIVTGKYLAAASIFTASLLFSQFSNFLVLNALALGDIDTGLFVATYAGYWMMGLAMLAVGMVASFLTSNLTVGFILGAVFNAPLAFLVVSDVIIPGRGLAQLLTQWSLSAQFADFGRGVISLSGVVYFLTIIVVGLYLSMVLIGRRHWYGGRDGKSMLGHYILRGLALVVVALAATVFFSNHDLVRHDATSEKISSLSPDTRKLIRELKTDQPVLIEAFLSASVPEDYVKTKMDLIAMITEFGKQGSGNVQFRINSNLEPFSENASRAEDQYGIKAEPILTQGRGQLTQEEIFMGVAFTCGLEKVVVPFFGPGLPVEYELVRSVCTVTDAQRRKIGVVRTDAQLYGSFDMTRMAPPRKQAIIQELEKQYDVEEVDPNEPIDVEKYDALLAVQPSSLPQPQLNNLIDAVRNGMPTAIFEDPFPVTPGLSSAPGTGEPRRPPRNMGMMGMRQPPPEPKGNIQDLWKLLGIEMVGDAGMSGGYDAQVIWQKYNPYPKVRQVWSITDEWVFVGPDAPGADDPLNSSQSITSKLTQILFLFPGAFDEVGSTGLKFTPLVTTGNETGTINVQDLRSQQMAPPGLLNSNRRGRYKQYVLAARIQGPLKDDMAASISPTLLAQNDAAGPPGQELGPAGPAEADDGDSPDQEEVTGAAGPADSSGQDEPGTSNEANGDADQEDDARETKKRDIDVVFVTDIDLLYGDFLSLRARPESEVNFRFDNVTFVLNVLDVLAGDNRFVEVRKRETRYPTLQMVEMRTAAARDQASDAIVEYKTAYDKAVAEAEERMKKPSTELQKEIDKLQETAPGDQVSFKRLQAALTRLEVQRQIEQQRLTAVTEQQRRTRDGNMRRIERELESQIREVQTWFKFWAVILPIVPPLALGMVVFFRRRSRERESITVARRR